VKTVYKTQVLRTVLGSNILQPSYKLQHMGQHYQQFFQQNSFTDRNIHDKETSIMAMVITNL